ncbi:MAG: VWA domain-containing protein [Paludibacterium sp.]|uniref:vWA domain-containing protein n=3 Tax=Paludibacterium sp. TaxID=1917523 RepID=UPI0025EAFEA5|nr:VWA domain-containing protein [Paludibacterium sp.]MBV8046649.1 VWA domain-containing protein [Paludibacterium sp.]
MRRQRLDDGRRERGAVTLMAAFGMVALIGCAGLALDGGMAYLTRARLSSAVDGAALAAGRVLVLGGRFAEAESVAQAYFDSAYFAQAYAAGLTPVKLNLRLLSQRPLHLQVSAQIRQPLYLMPVLGMRDMAIAAEAEVANTRRQPATAGSPAVSRRKGVDLMMVTDMSSSILHSSDWVHVVRESKKVFESLDARSDRVAQIIYGDGVKTLLPFQPRPGFDLAEMRRLNGVMQTPNVPELDGGAGGGTATGPALAQANEALARLPARAPLPVLLLFTDGVANLQCMDPRRPGDALSVPCRRIGVPVSQSSNETVAQMREGIRAALDRGTTVLIVGYGRELRGTPHPVPEGIKSGEAWLLDALAQPGEAPRLDANQTYSNGNGMYCWSGDPVGLKACYDKVIQVVTQAGAPGAPGSAGPLRLIR